MKKTFSFYAIVWVIVLVIFNLIWFIVPESVSGADRKEANFWIGYIFTTLSLLGHLACVYYAFKRGINNMFYNFNLVDVSYSSLLSMLFVSSLVMLIKAIPVWLGVLLCLVILLLNIIAIVKAAAPAAMVSAIDKKIKTQTLFVKSLSVDAQGLVNRAQTEESKNICTQVYEAIRYSDPMSNDALSGIESQITIKFASFSEAVTGNNDDVIKAQSKELLALIADRNNRCKILK